jgi:hypothetical protein
MGLHGPAWACMGGHLLRALGPRKQGQVGIELCLMARGVCGRLQAGGVQVCPVLGGFTVLGHEYR